LKRYKIGPDEKISEKFRPHAQKNLDILLKYGESKNGKMISKIPF